MGSQTNAMADTMPQVIITRANHRHAPTVEDNVGGRFEQVLAPGASRGTRARVFTVNLRVLDNRFCKRAVRRWNYAASRLRDGRISSSAGMPSFSQWRRIDGVRRVHQQLPLLMASERAASTSRQSPYPILRPTATQPRPEQHRNLPQCGKDFSRHAVSSSRPSGHSRRVCPDPLDEDDRPHRPCAHSRAPGKVLDVTIISALRRSKPNLGFSIPRHYPAPPGAALPSSWSLNIMEDARLLVPCSAAKNFLREGDTARSLRTEREASHRSRITGSFEFRLRLLSSTCVYIVEPDSYEPLQTRSRGHVGLVFGTENRCLPQELFTMMIWVTNFVDFASFSSKMMPRIPT